jgi:hypothetical protein
MMAMFHLPATYVLWDMSPVKRNVTIQLKPELHRFFLPEYECRPVVVVFKKVVAA